jgi:PAS domain S-box-containing protein
VSTAPHTLVVALLGGAIVCAALAVFSVRHREVRGAAALAALTAAMSWWSAGHAVELAAADPGAVLLWARIQHVGALLVPALWLAFILQWSGRERFFTPVGLIALFGIPVLTIVTVLVEGGAGLYFTPRETSIVKPASDGPVAWVHLGHAYLALLSGAALLLRQVVSSRGAVRSQALLLLLATTIPWSGNLAYLAGIVPHPELRPTALLLAVGASVTAYGIFRYRLLDVVPVARDALLEEMVDAVIVLDGEGRVLDMNPAAAELVGMPPRQAVGRDGAAVMSGLPELLPHLAGSGSAQAEARVAGNRGERTYEARLSPLRDPRGVATGRLLVMRDVTDRRRAHEELRRAKEEAEAASSAKSRFVASVSHELRNPLTSIIGFSDLLLHEAARGDRARLVPDLQKIRAAGHHLLGLVNDVLDLSKVEAGTMAVHPERFEVMDLVREALEAMQPLAEANGNRIELRGLETAGMVRTDRRKLKQILVNLLANAAKFTREGLISVTVEREREREDERLSFRVADTGIGIAPEQRSRLFLPFMQADPTATRRYGGTGLGLAITKRFVELLGGSIHVESTLGAGSAFTVRLPAELPRGDLVVVLPGGDAGHEEEVVLAGPVRRELVLVIDDDPSARELVARLFELEGARVVTAPGGVEGLRLAREVTPDLIALDLVMPGMDGAATLAELKADAELREIPVVLVSVADESERRRPPGAADYLVKPPERARIAELLRRYGRSARPPG